MFRSTTALLWFVLCACTAPAFAQDGNLPWQEYSRLVEQGREIAILDVNSMFGDRVDLYSGALSFSTTDVSIPGNNALPVAVTRKLDIHDRKKYGTGGRKRAFADWDIDIPNVSGVFGPTWHDNRCSQAAPPNVQVRVTADEYWAGNHADLPGGGEMLRDSNRPTPTTGGPYLWITEGDTYFSCLSSIVNGTGQGFLAIDTNGNKYWLNHMAQYGEPNYISVDRQASPERVVVSRRKNVLYATRVEDRFGNWVTYTYSNAADQPLRLTAISSSDSRSLTFQYNASGYVASISDGVRAWTYQYTGHNLTGVLLPDGSNWNLNLSGLSNAVIQMSNDPNDMRSCFSLDDVLSGDVSGSMMHPSGATATFVVAPYDVGRTNVPGICRNYQLPGSPGSDTRDDYPVFPVRWVSLVAKSKQVQGAGIAPMQWTYGLSSWWSWQYPHGATQPICSTGTCADPVCLSDGCAGNRTMVVNGPDGAWNRYTFGNSYRYNEGKLLRHEQGTSHLDVLRTVIHTYNYATSGQPYAAKIGSSPQQRGAGFTSEYPRPLVKTETVQDGGLFLWEVAKGCTASGVYCLDVLARPTRVIRTGNVTGGGSGGPATPPLTAPVLTAPATNNTGSYAISWTSVALASAYELREQLGSGSWNVVHIGSGTSAAISGNGSGSWNYQVRGCNGAGCGPWSATRTAVVTLSPSGVPVVTAPTANTTGSYTVSWTAVPGANRYELDQRRNAGAWSKVHDGAGTVKALGGQASGTYDYRARACNAGGCGADSALSSTVITLAALGAPTLTAPSSVSQDRRFTVSWTAISGATSYVLELNFNGGGYTQVYSGAATSASQTLSEMGGYLYRVRACNASGCGPSSPEKPVTVTLGP
ncbi:hypothetical protein LDO31_16400 [Luteimonas sp. XNQY3]|nr:chitinase N-terminal domain-containing protein [Luteimonas sp. XNQY3]MCD9007782.1 hypothetical protein [Luteimonas sp. XNQY3]